MRCCDHDMKSTRSITRLILAKCGTSQKRRQSDILFLASVTTPKRRSYLYIEGKNVKEQLFRQVCGGCTIMGKSLRTTELPTAGNSSSALQHGHASGWFQVILKTRAFDSGSNAGAISPISAAAAVRKLLSLPVCSYRRMPFSFQSRTHDMLRPDNGLQGLKINYVSIYYCGDCGRQSWVLAEQLFSVLQLRVDRSIG